ncbi:DUF6493 family protein [Catenulispora pinisilvae]|uniref:DUF6493 family protein n=1 Tax=Catenulispora pinisilvae TaxID=2705253 RepID=UPI00189107AF|nr:DUF6493 family protein [Catenulispora pinisilvae]
MSAEGFAALMALGDAGRIAPYFEGMTEKERRTYVAPLKEFLKSVSWGAVEGSNWTELKKRRARANSTVIPAALAVFPSALTTAKFLRTVQREGVFDPGSPAAVAQVLADRAPAWLPDLPAALLATLEPDGCHRLVAAVNEVAGVPMEATREFLRAWGVEYLWSTWSADDEKQKAKLLADPKFGEYLPLMFDDDENDELFTSWSVFGVTAAEAVRAGLVARAPVLDGCLRRLLRGGQPGAMQVHLAFWTALEPSDAEVVEWVSSCISLLSSQSGAVARSFLASVKKASDADLIDVELALEAASIAVTRSEKNVVKTALTWLDGLFAKHPERTAQIAQTVAIAFGAQAADIQERALKVVGRRAKGLGEAERERLAADAAIYLAPDLVAKLAGLLGVSQDSPTADAGDSDVAPFPEVAPYVPRPLLPPIGSPAELAEVVASLSQSDPAEAMVFERVLEAVVVFQRTDAAGMREALAPVMERYRPGWDWNSSQIGETPRIMLGGLAAAAAGLGADKRREPHRVRVGQLWSRMRKSNRGWPRRTRTSPADFLLARLGEVHAALGLPDLPPLVSVPTSPTGAIDPSELVRRLRDCEAQGLEPLEADFHQALLRLPADCGAVDVTGFRSKAGRRLAAWVGGDRVEIPTPEFPDPAMRQEGNGDLLAAYKRAAMSAHVKSPDTLLDLVRGVWSEPERCWDQSDWAVCWPAIVPTRPDLAAVAMIGGIDWTSAPAVVESAVVLAEQDGAQSVHDGSYGGPHSATHRVIAARLVHEDARMRASGVDAALVLAARELLDPATLAATLAIELPIPGAGLRRAVPGLRDLANAGAATQTWEAIALLLPALLPPALPKALPGTADLLVLATELAGALKVRRPIAEVTALARKKGGGAVPSGARRLAGALGDG